MESNLDIVSVCWSFCVHYIHSHNEKSNVKKRTIPCMNDFSITVKKKSERD